MSVNLVIAVTDNNWFEYLSHRPDLSEVNFWTPLDPVGKKLQSTETG